MKRWILAFIVLIVWPTHLAGQSPELEWSSSDIAVLKRWADAAPVDALPRISTLPLDKAVASGDHDQANSVATSLALRLARMHLFGAASQTERAGWRIPDSDVSMPLESMLGNALANEALDTFFAMLRPVHHEYSALRTAYGRASINFEERRAIARNMERWRWMPRSLGDNYVLVNTAAFEASLWREGMKTDTWPVIVGKTSTPTPVFSATIEGVIFNPWWEIPASIVRESIGSLVRRNPSLAKARGYVWANGRYRQRPGPNNALGQMKLVMPNPFSVYMHDTPNKQLFDEQVRTFSHGCIRTGNAIGFATTLLEGVKTREEVDEIVSSLKTTRVDLAHPIPVFITYFTAVSDGAGDVKFLPDVYNRDRRIEIAQIESECSASG